MGGGQRRRCEESDGKKTEEAKREYKKGRRIGLTHTVTEETHTYSVTCEKLKKKKDPSSVIEVVFHTLNFLKKEEKGIVLSARFLLPRTGNNFPYIKHTLS